MPQPKSESENEEFRKERERSYPCRVFPQVASFILYAVWVLYSLEELDFLNDILPFLSKDKTSLNQTVLFQMS